VPSLEVRRRSLAAVRWRARAPQLALHAVVALVGVSAALSIARGAPPQPIVHIARGATSPPTEIGAFAQRFVRAWLTWDARRPERHQQALVPFLSSGLDPDGGLIVPAQARQAVTWTILRSVSAVGPGRYSAVVAVGTTGAPGGVDVVVSVSRAREGGLVVSDYPALVGPPQRADAGPVAGEPVADPSVLAVVGRALANYLARNQTNLRADLLPGVDIAVPEQPLSLRALDAAAWQAPGVLGATVRCTSADGAQWQLTYRIAVVRRDRWFVAAINPPARPSKEVP
jgi:hypothetical protein